MEGAGTVRLLALAPSGETYFVEIDGKTWLIRPPGAGDPRLVDRAIVDRAVSDHGFDKEERLFETWADLDKFRNEVAARIAPVVAGVESFDAADIRRMLDVARRWQAAGDGRSARLLGELLHAPAVDSDPGLLADIVTLLKREVPDVIIGSPPDSEIGRMARQQYQAPAAA